ncbi:nucleoside 2-deoxyribosyltransferase [Pelagibaculum spongiae]|uniref:Nucleoside 2-deoxyribosyltransferase n=1 Tax=Pelagibaculum spongiae TaxID=2080658 RepID=A0A2V1GWZ8_9GAMM|nr:nucleoside 2-deoxyribosyltransferase [Pelagibaculum spongiae]PVZ70530.1 nucleoside 2-deoxyribosyltransferase [Pelagibaculum spongiae]
MKKAYFGIKFYPDNQNRPLIDAISAALEAQKIETFCVARDLEKWGEIQFTNQNMMQLTFAEIDQSDLVVIEMSEKGVGLGIEAGYAVAKGKQLILLIQQGIELSATMDGIADRVLYYSDPSQIVINI